MKDLAGFCKVPTSIIFLLREYSIFQYLRGNISEENAGSNMNKCIFKISTLKKNAAITFSEIFQNSFVGLLRIFQGFYNLQ